MSYVFVADSNSDLPYTHVDALGIQMIHMPYMLGSEEYFADLGRNPERLRSFYAAMREGAPAKTSLLPTQFYLEFFTPFLEAGQDILYIAFSFQLSQTQTNAIHAANQLLERFPERRIEIVDTLSISMGYGMIVYEAATRKKNGASFDEVRDYALSARSKSHHWFSVEDLQYLKRGGRLRASAAMFGTLLDVKPLLSVNKEGVIFPFEKTKGRKKAMRTLVQRALECLPDNPEDTIVCVLNADCMNDALSVAAMIKEGANVKDIWHAPVGQVVCSHCGPGTLGIVFIGKERTV